MAGASDKARYYLEQSIPELRELEKSRIFTKDEIRSIARKRSDFEHKLNARGSKPIDYARYLEFEMNMESLRKKRVKRMGSKAKNYYVAERRMMSIMDRATTKFHGDLALWMQYFDLARRQKAYNKASRILTEIVRLQPTKPDVWIYAAKYAFEEQGDMNEARSYMTRGRRFCKSSRQLWLESARLELIYIAKIVARRHILGLDEERRNALVTDEDDPDADILALPTITAEDFDPSLKNIETGDGDPSKKLNILLEGSIPIAIFDSAFKEFKDAAFGGDFFDMTAGIEGIPCMRNILEHVVDCLRSFDPSSPITLDAAIRLPLIGIDTTTAEFPRALGVALAQLKSCMEEHPSLELAKKTMKWIGSYLKGDIDDDLRTVLTAIMSRSLSQYKDIATKTEAGSAEEARKLLETLQALDLPEAIDTFGQWAIATWPSDDNIRHIVDMTPADTIVVH